MGRMLRDAVSWQGINISNLVMDKEVPTTLAFVHTVSGGSRNGEGRRGVDFL